MTSITLNHEGENKMTRESVQSAKAIRDLERLGAELKEELDDAETSTLSELVNPGPIRDRDLYLAVKAVQEHYGGKLPLHPRRAWRGMLDRADEGRGESDECLRLERYYELVDRLHRWVSDEFFQLKKKSAPKKPGRPPTHDRPADVNLVGDWKAAKNCGENKESFCQALGISMTDLRKACDRIRSYEYRKDQKQAE